MTIPTASALTVTIAAIHPPFDASHGVMFGLQSKHGVDDPIPASTSADFVTEIEVRTGGDAIDFAGDHVHGRRGDRFLYLSWGVPDQTEPFVMFARAKIKLADIPPDLLDHAIEQKRPLQAVLQATDSRGQPASGTIKPPAIRWSAG
ncbi:MAG: DUF5990 family protein [Acidimicrobiia bacterium]